MITKGFYLAKSIKKILNKYLKYSINNILFNNFIKSFIEP